jgi:tetratricopeptide (TPR) repeat protein
LTSSFFRRSPSRLLALLALGMAAGGCQGPRSQPPANFTAPGEEAALRQAAQQSARDPRPRVTLVGYLAREGRRCDALDEARAAFEAFPDSGPVRLSLAHALAGMERFSEAAALVRSQAAVDEQYRLILARYLLRAGDRAGAAAALRPLEKSGKNALEAGQVCLDALQFEEARRFFRLAAKESPQDPDAQAHLGLSLLLLGRYREAAAPLEKAAQGTPGAAAVRFYLGAAYRLGGAAGKAAAPLKQAVDLEPRSAPYRYELGLARLAAGDAAGAEAELREAALLQPGTAEYQRDLARAYRRNGKAIPGAGAQGRYLRLLGDGPAAAAALEPAVRAHPAEPALALELGEAYYDAWQTPKTLALLEGLRKRTPDDREVLTALFRARKAAHQYRQALEVLDRLAAGAPDDLALKDQRAELLQLLGRYPEVEQVLQELRDREPGSAVRHYRLGVALAQWSARPDRAAAAETEFREAVRLDSNYADAHYRLGLLRQAAGDTAEATRSFRRCLDLSPRMGDALKALAGAYALQGEPKREQELMAVYRTRKAELDEQARLEEPATLRRPTGAERRALGLFYLRTLRYEAAASELESAAHAGALAPAERGILAALYGHLRRFQRMAEERAALGGNAG